MTGKEFPNEGGYEQMPKLPLEEIRVVDFTVVWAGPYGTMMLGDLGAEIIRVESINRFPVFTRGLLPRPTKEMVAFLGLSR